MSKICVVGSMNTDMVIAAEKMPVIGQTVRGSGFMTAEGGKGANQAVAAKRLGAEVAMVGASGDDIFGKRMRQGLEKEGIDCRCVRTVESCPSGIAVICVVDGNNFIVIDSGANSEVVIDGEAEKAIAESDMTVIQLEIPEDTVYSAIRTAHKNGVRVLLNPAPARLIDSSILKLIDIITPNETEAEFLTGIKINGLDDAKEAAVFLNNKGIPLAVITLGGSGCVFGTEGKTFHVPATDDKPVDTTAAGDCFSAALAVGLCEKMTVEDAVMFATRASGITITRKGAQPSLPYRNEL